MSRFLCAIRSARFSLCCVAFLSCFACLYSASGGDAGTDWATVTALDAGPALKQQGQPEVKGAVIGHLAAQEKALRSFLANHPGDAHDFEARLRLARVLSIRSDFDSSPKMREEKRRILDELEQSNLTPQQRAEVDFSNISSVMRHMRSPTGADREHLLELARKFETDHPEDRRLASLLAEVSVLFDNQPKTKEELLVDARRLTTDEELKARIADDLLRISLVGSEVQAQAPAADGGAIDLAEYRGKVVLLAFFARWSPPSMDSITAIEAASKRFSGDRLQAIGVSLDESKNELSQVIHEHHVTWPIAFDGKGWDGKLVRSLGINALPTVWLIDEKGRLRSLNAMENLVPMINQLLEEHVDQR